MNEQTVLTDIEAIRAWFVDTVFEGAILIELVIDKLKEEAILVTSCSTEPANHHQYRFRKATFYSVKELGLEQFLRGRFACTKSQEILRYNCIREKRRSGKLYSNAKA